MPWVERIDPNALVREQGRSLVAPGYAVPSNWSQIATSSQSHGGRRSRPYAFTEHGAIQAANILNSDAAAEMSVHVVRAFIQLRQMVVIHKAIATKLAELDARLGQHDEQLAAMVAALRQLTMPDGPRHRRKIGFHQGNR